MAAHRHHGVVPICRTLQVAPSAVRSVMWRPVCARRLADEKVKPILLAVFDANYRVYGRRKMKAAYVASRRSELPLVWLRSSSQLNWGSPQRRHAGVGHYLEQRTLGINDQQQARDRVPRRMI